ncbi:PssE/Cps14G family polysaccharide biosynthesis glycosyltransferase [Clostridium disporicum]|uniref:PssE/Cps14G family polysaccharide biosynthesis glycosyltransferase n=1 Tax=Clostridium disporicum TaxID=84024 RepID=UPI00360F5012
MIFVTLGSQKFQFNRLLIEIDKLIEDKKITEEVFAQTGYSDYEPRNYEYKNFLDRDEFANIMGKCDKVITHGGTGAIIGAVKNGKKVIAVPRLSIFGEHVDDHQLQITEQFNKMGFIRTITDIKKLGILIKEINDMKLAKYESNTGNIIKSIDTFLKS